MSSQPPHRVRTRRVFYVPGYDPFPPRRYRELYRKEAAAQAAISGHRIVLRAGLPREGFGWQVEAEIEGHPVSAEVEVLVWSDIVQQSRPHSVATTYLDLLKTAWIYISTGALFRLMRLRKGPVIAALYPVVALLMQAGLAMGIGWALFRVTTRMAAELALAVPPVALAVVCAGLATAAAAFVLRWFRENDGRFFAYYLMHDFAYSAAEKGAYPAELEARLRDFRHRIAAALREDVDEVLVVGHSSGAHLAVSILSDLIRAGEVPHDGPALAFLSLGHVVPMVSFLPRADRLRRDLQVLSQSSDITWVDVTAPGDGCCFALCDPVAVSGVATDEKRGPLVFSAAFTQSLSPARWKALRWRFFRLHFQYLCAFDQPKDYDYFALTAGPLRLKDRYRHRKPSRSRIQVATSAYRSVAP
jgi:hypothetical protein